MLWPVKLSSEQWYQGTLSVRGAGVGGQLWLWQLIDEWTVAAISEALQQSWMVVPQRSSEDRTWHVESVYWFQRTLEAHFHLRSYYCRTPEAGLHLRSCLKLKNFKHQTGQAWTFYFSIFLVNCTILFISTLANLIMWIKGFVYHSCPEIHCIVIYKFEKCIEFWCTWV